MNTIASAKLPLTTVMSSNCQGVWSRQSRPHKRFDRRSPSALTGCTFESGPITEHCAIAPYLATRPLVRPNSQSFNSRLSPIDVNTAIASEQFAKVELDRLLSF